MEDRRVHPRLKEQNSVVIRVLSAPQAEYLKNQKFFCTTDDISAGGLRFCVTHDVPVGALLEITIALLDPLGTFKHVGKVVWIKQVDDFKYALGLEFTDMSKNRRSAWRYIVEKKLARRPIEDESVNAEESTS